MSAGYQYRSAIMFAKNKRKPSRRQLAFLRTVSVQPKNKSTIILAKSKIYGNNNQKVLPKKLNPHLLTQYTYFHLFFSLAKTAEAVLDSQERSVWKVYRDFSLHICLRRKQL